MLARVKLKCWPNYINMVFGAEDGQHFNSKTAWFCRDNKIFEKKNWL